MEQRRVEPRELTVLCGSSAKGWTDSGPEAPRESREGGWGEGPKGREEGVEGGREDPRNSQDGRKRERTVGLRERERDCHLRSDIGFSRQKDK